MERESNSVVSLRPSEVNGNEALGKYDCRTRRYFGIGSGTRTAWVAGLVLFSWKSLLELSRGARHFEP